MNTTGFSENYFIDFADQALAKLEDGLDAADDYANILLLAERGGAMGFAKYLHGINESWKDLEHGKETFEDRMLRKFNKDRATIQRRVCMWEFLTSIVPSHLKESFLLNWTVGMFSRGYRVAVKHSKNKKTGNYDFIPSGYEIDPNDWLALSECIDMPMLIERLDKITKREPNKNRISFSVDMTGAIWFYRGKKEQVVIGSLLTGSDNALVQDGITEALEKLGAK